MALLSTGSTAAAVLDLDSPVESQILQAFSEDTHHLQEEAVQELLSSVVTQDQVSSPFSPNSDTSSDSGITHSVSDEDLFLAGLFGSNYPALSMPTSDTVFSQNLLPLHQQSADVVESTQEPKREKVSESQLERNRKNAEAARQNRLKKKRYLDDLEKEKSTLKTENVILKTKCHEFQQRCQKLQAEVEYLKSVLANESALSSLIQNIPNVSNVKLTTSFTRKRPNSEGPGGTPKRAKKSSHSGGVCLHVSKDIVSLEFCQNCSKQASQS